MKDIYVCVSLIYNTHIIYRNKSYKYTKAKKKSCFLLDLHVKKK